MGIETRKLRFLLIGRRNEFLYRGIESAIVANGHGVFSLDTSDASNASSFPPMQDYNGVVFLTEGGGMTRPFLFALVAHLNDTLIPVCLVGDLFSLDDAVKVIPHPNIGLILKRPVDARAVMESILTMRSKGAMKEDERTIYLLSDDDRFSDAFLQLFSDSYHIERVPERKLLGSCLKDGSKGFSLIDYEILTEHDSDTLRRFQSIEAFNRTPFSALIEKDDVVSVGKALALSACGYVPKFATVDAIRSALEQSALGASKARKEASRKKPSLSSLSLQSGRSASVPVIPPIRPVPYHRS